MSRNPLDDQSLSMLAAGRPDLCGRTPIDASVKITDANVALVKGVSEVGKRLVITDLVITSATASVLDLTLYEAATARYEFNVERWGQVVWAFSTKWVLPVNTALNAKLAAIATGNAIVNVRGYEENG